jgi:protein-tyrosine phosphatase
MYGKGRIIIMVHVLFVCLGNICRSPMAEAVLRHKVREAGLEGKIQVDSAGTGSWHTGNIPHEGTRRKLKDYGISDKGITARQVREQDFQVHRYIVPMDAANASDLLRFAPPAHEAQVMLLMDFVEGKEGAEVPDPYYTGNFQEVYEMVDAGCEALLRHIRSREEL